MRAWAFMLGGLIVWTVHFFALYAIGSIFLTTTFARVLVLLVSAGCVAADGLLLAQAVRTPPGDAADSWMRRLALLSAMLSLVAVIWQALPALLV